MCEFYSVHQDLEVGYQTPESCSITLGTGSRVLVVLWVISSRGTSMALFHCPLSIIHRRCMCAGHSVPKNNAMLSVEHAAIVR